MLLSQICILSFIAYSVCVCVYIYIYIYVYRYTQAVLSRYIRFYARTCENLSWLIVLVRA